MLNRTLILYLIGVFTVGFTVDGGIYAVIFNLFLLRLGYGPEFIGLINGIALLVFTLVSLPAGILGGRKGTRRIMRLGLGTMIVGCGVLPLGEFLPDSVRTGWLITLFVIVYIGLALYFVNGPPYLISSAPPDQRDRVFSRQVAVWSMAAFAGSLSGGLIPGWIAPLLGLTLDNPAPYRYPLFITSLVLIPGLLAISALRDVHGLPSPDRDRSAEAPEEPVSRRLVIMLAVIRMLQVGVIAATVPFFNVYMDRVLQVPTMQIGLMTSLGRLLSAPLALLTPWFTARLGAARTVFTFSMLNAVSNIPMILIPTVQVAGLSFIGVTSLSSIRYGAFLVFSLNVVPPRARATLSGISEMGSGICFTLISLLGGQIVARFGFPPLFILGATLSVIGTLLFWATFMLKKPVSQDVPAASV